MPSYQLDLLAPEPEPQPPPEARRVRVRKDEPLLPEVVLPVSDGLRFALRYHGAATFRVWLRDGGDLVTMLGGDAVAAYSAERLLRAARMEGWLDGSGERNRLSLSLRIFLERGAFGGERRSSR